MCVASCLPRASGYRCEASTDCVRDGVAGTCELVGFCSFPDPTCDDGRRFGELASSYSGRCVGEITDGGMLPDTPPGFHRVGGTVSGLTASGLVLRNNGADSLSVAANGSFQFATPVAESAAYSVSVEMLPPGQLCLLNNASGVVGTSDVTSVMVTCTQNSSSDPGIACNTGLYCAPGLQVCCADKDMGIGSCLDSGSVGTCTGKPIYCDSAADCGGGSAVCCAMYVGGQFKSTECRTSESACLAEMINTTVVEIWCDLMAQAACPGMQTCAGSSSIGPFHTCQ